MENLFVLCKQATRPISESARPLRLLLHVEDQPILDYVWTMGKSFDLWFIANSFTPPLLPRPLIFSLTPPLPRRPLIKLMFRGGPMKTISGRSEEWKQHPKCFEPTTNHRMLFVSPDSNLMDPRLLKVARKTIASSSSYYIFWYWAGFSVFRSR